MEILVGGLLGDAYISKRGAIQIEQGERQKDYIFWKYKELNSITSGKVSQVFRKKKNDKVNSSFRFFSKQYFRPWRMSMYKSGKKVIPLYVLELITPLSLAVWYMDDGCKKNNYSIIISTDGFSIASLKKLRTMLQEKWFINSRIIIKTTAGKKYRRLTIGSYDLVRFFELIRPYVIPSMKYKISDPVTTQSIKRRERLYLN
jgi:recombination protein RecA